MKKPKKTWKVWVAIGPRSFAAGKTKHLLDVELTESDEQCDPSWGKGKCESSYCASGSCRRYRATLTLEEMR